MYRYVATPIALCTMFGLRANVAWMITQACKNGLSLSRRAMVVPALPTKSRTRVSSSPAGAMLFSFCVKSHYAAILSCCSSGRLGVGGEQQRTHDGVGRPSRGKDHIPTCIWVSSGVNFILIDTGCWFVKREIGPVVVAIATCSTRPRETRTP